MHNRHMRESSPWYHSHWGYSSPELIPFILHVFTYTIIYLSMFKSTDIVNVKGSGLQSLYLILAVLDALQFKNPHITG